MANRTFYRFLPSLVVTLASLQLPVLTAQAVVDPWDDPAWQIEPSWKPLDSDQVYARLIEYLKRGAIEPERQIAVRDQWSAGAADELLDRLAACLARADDRVAELVEFCRATSYVALLPEFDWLADSQTPPLVRDNMRLYLARWLVQEGFYDEAIAWTDGLATDDVAAPDALLFYRAVAHHCLVEPEKADPAVSQLLQREDDLPLRYQKLATLMQQDLATLQDDSLDHIARRMEDVRRRLVKGRAGERVQDVENRIIESLDKLIEDIEDQLAQAAAAMGGGGSSGGQPSGQPMEESQLPAGQKAPGDVDRRDVGRESGWGNMPDRERERALQDIGREFPSHYREVIEEYFRRLAAEESAERP